MLKKFCLSPRITLIVHSKFRRTLLLGSYIGVVLFLAFIVINNVLVIVNALL
jgi:hypothetical protein